MANNFDIKDFTLGTAKTIKSTDNASVHTPHHNVDTLTTITNVVHVDDNSSSLTVDGAVTVTNATAADLKAEVTIAAAQTLATVTTVSAVTAISNALPAGTNNIGDVDVLTVPTDPFGANADAASATGSISAKLRGIATALGVTAFDLGSGTGGTRTLRQFLDTAQWIGGAGNVTSATQRTTLAADDPAVAVLGTTSGAKVITDATGTIQQYLRGIISQWISRTLTFASTGYAARVSVTRPSDTTTYAAGDVVGVTGGGTGTITFPNMGPAAGEIMITSLRFQRNATALIASEAGYKLHLFSVTQPAGQADNAVFDVASGDQASYLGYIPIPTPTDLGSTLHSEVNGINKQVTLASTSLFGVLTTDGAYQPASAAVHVVELHSVAV
jgi:hypothetical protein